MSRKNSPPDRDALRTAAEAELDRRTPLMAALTRPADELLHELQVHQIELEMQNEALRQSRNELEESRDCYLDLFDFAPVGLLTLTPEASIAEINFAAADLLGSERGKLLGSRFEKFVAAEDSERWHRHFRGSLKEAVTRHIELTLQRADGSLRNAGIGCLCVETGGKPREMRVALTDITERKQTENKLRESQQLLRDLAAGGAAMLEARLKHIAREVHDEMGQLLTALRIDISLLRIEFGERDPLLKEKIAELIAHVDNILRAAREVATNLRPAALDMGVIQALTWLCDEFPGRTNTACSLQVIDHVAELDEARTMAIFRIVQESLTNVARYAAANSVKITVKKQHDDVVVEVHDDGVGFAADKLNHGSALGLVGMRERALAVGGKVEIVSSPSKGTLVSLRIPYRQKG